MDLKVIFKTARCAVVELLTGEIFETTIPYRIYVNDQFYEENSRIIVGIYDLKPSSDYEVRIVYGQEEALVKLHTQDEFVTLNVRDFGAKGDGLQDDTLFIQTAIHCCPVGGRVLIPAGEYKVSTVFLKDHLKLEIAKGAVLSAYTDREKFPVLKGLIDSYDETEQYNLGTWEGNPLSMYSSIITGIQVHDVIIYGQGVIEGNADDKPGNWWYNSKEMNGIFRPRMIYLNRCREVVVQGIMVQNSPSWNIHPYFSRHLRFIGLTVRNPKDSPNTDGLDPESCRDVEIVGVQFSLGDDCIAVKSGKIYMGAKYKTPSEDIMVRQCCMMHGHGSVTIGSEMAGGVKNLTVRDCLFLNTDRGLRIKTRRGRGEAAVVDGILFEHIRMDHVMTPFVINSFYFCDPDGHSEYVRTKEPLPVDERTPKIKSLIFRDIEAANCHVAAAFFYGLPEQKIERIEMDRVHVTYAAEAKKDVPAMMEGVEACSRQGIYANQIQQLLMSDVVIEGQEGEALTLLHIDEVKDN